MFAGSKINENEKNVKETGSSELNSSSTVWIFTNMLTVNEDVFVGHLLEARTFLFNLFHMQFIFEVGKYGGIKMSVKKSKIQMEINQGHHDKFLANLQCQ